MGSPPQRLARLFAMKTFKAISSGILFFAMASQMIYLKFGDALEARFPVIKTIKQNVAASRAPRDESDVYALKSDGSAVDPRGYRKALMKDRRALAATLQAALRFADATGEKNRVSFVPGDKAAPVGVP